MLLRAKIDGFTLLETLVVIFIMVVVVVGVSSLLVQIIASISSSSLQLTASYLAQEGIEIVRNIRDSNYLEKRAGQPVLWDQGIPAGTFGLDLNTRALPDSSCSGYGLKISSSNFYTCTSDPTAPFRRRVVISKSDLDGEPSTIERIEISSIVEWQEKGRVRTITVNEHLYDWFK